MMIFKCYPTINDLVVDLVGTDILFVPIYSFGFFVMCAFLVASFVLGKELKKRYELGLIPHSEKTIIKGEGPKFMDFFTTGIITFLAGMKFIGFLFNPASCKINPQHYLFSAEGSIIGGLVFAIAYMAYKYWKVKKEQLSEPLKEKVKVLPHHLVGDFIVIAAIAGIVGVNVFSFIEEPGSFKAFLQNPDPMALFSGLTIYGGFIFGSLGILIYAFIKKVHFGHLFDALSPAYMLAYGIGRIGCQVSGDGDWGIINTLDKPSWIPQFLWAQQYENNIAGDCCWAKDASCGCSFAETPYLIDAVWPTPIYETFLSVVIFVALIMIMKNIRHIPGMLFGIMLIFNGIERFFIEQIRTTARGIKFLGMELSQAMFIALLLILGGTILSFTLYRMRNKQKV